MNRFSEESAASFAANVAQAAYLRLYQEDPPAPEIELPTCEGCGKDCAELQPVDAGFDMPLQCCPACVSEFAFPSEPECTCIQTDVDVCDASCCDCHGYRREVA